MHKTRNNLPVETREKTVELLNRHLADLSDLFSQTKQAHWNVNGPNFFELHQLFDKLGDGVVEFVDQVAERITSLGGTAMGTIRMAAAASRLPEYPVEVANGIGYVEALADRFAMVGSSARAAIDTAGSWGDADTADLFTEISRELDKNLWFLEAHLTGAGIANRASAI